MRKYLFFVLVYFVTIKSNAQKLPQYYITDGDTAGIILSIEQVKRIKNDLELKSILEDMRISCDSTISKYIIVVDDYEKKVVSLKRTIDKMDSTDKNNQELIKSIRKSLELEKKDKSLCDSASIRKDSIITNSETIISDLKCKRNLGYGGTVLFFITTILIWIF